MSTEPEEYIDEQTGIRLTVEQEPPYTPEQPRITVFPPEGSTLSLEEAKEAIRRLLAMAGRTPPIQQQEGGA